MLRREMLLDMRRELVRLRENALLSRKALAHKLGVTDRTVRRWETGASTPEIDVRADLADALKCSVAEVNAAIAGAMPNEYHVVAHDLGMLVGLEQSAVELRWWESVTTPALLQTEAYATAVESVGPFSVSPEEISRRVSLRLQRQQVLTKPYHPLKLWALLDASILLRMTGDSDVMAGQIAHLHAMNERPNIQIRTTPLDGRAHVVRGAFMLLTAPGGDVPYVVVSETVSDVTYQGSAPDVSAHLTVWDHLWSMSDELA